MNTPRDVRLRPLYSRAPTRIGARRNFRTGLLVQLAVVATIPVLLSVMTAPRVTGLTLLGLAGLSYAVSRIATAVSPEARRTAVAVLSN